MERSGVKWIAEVEIDGGVQIFSLRCEEGRGEEGGGVKWTDRLFKLSDRGPIECPIKVRGGEQGGVEGSRVEGGWWRRGGEWIAGVEVDGGVQTV